VRWQGTHPDLFARLVNVCVEANPFIWCDRRRERCCIDGHSEAEEEEEEHEEESESECILSDEHH